MEPASKFLRKLTLPPGCVTPEETACAAWKAAVGKRIAVHARALKLVRTNLVVEVDDPVWKYQLFAMQKLIVRNLERRLGPGVVTDVEFKIAVQRKAPRRAVPSVSNDDADTIEDPVLRRIYKHARRREIA